jgi:regulatory protein
MRCLGVVPDTVSSVGPDSVSPTGPDSVSSGDDVRCSMRSRPPRPPTDTSPDAATTAGLALLGRRELTAAQVRERLLRKGYPELSVTEAIARLTSRGVIDDSRAAGARARHGVTIHRRGRARVLREVKALGVNDETARSAVAAAFNDVDEDRLLTETLQRRLRGSPLPADPRDRQRLYGWLLRQGFDSGRIRRALKTSPLDQDE